MMTETMELELVNGPCEGDFAPYTEGMATTEQVTPYSNRHPNAPVIVALYKIVRHPITGAPMHWKFVFTFIRDRQAA